jgi:hypothetical protein
VLFSGYWRGFFSVQRYLADRSAREVVGVASQNWQPNAAWVEVALIAHDLTVWTQQTCLAGEHAIAEPKRLRYRNADLAGMPILV